MSKLAKLLKKPRISRLITFGVVAVLIGVSAYFIYKRTVGADVPVACKVQLKDGVNIQFDGTQDTDQTGGTVVNGWPHIYLALNSINDTQFLSNQNRWIQIYGQGGTVYLHAKGSLPIMNPPLPAQPEIKSSTFDCTGGKIWEVTYANTSRTGTQGITVNQITPQSAYQTGSLYCIKAAQQTDNATYKWDGSKFIKQSGSSAYPADLPEFMMPAEGRVSSYSIQNGACATLPTNPNPNENDESGNTTGAVGEKKCWEAMPGNPILCTRTTSTSYDDEGQWSCSDGKTRLDSDFNAGTTLTLSQCGISSPGENGGDTSGGGGGGPDSPNTSTTAAGVQWKCFEMPPANNYGWFFKTKDNKWQNKDNANLIQTDTTNEVPVSNCGGTPPSTVPTNAQIATPQGSTKPGCPTGQKCYQHASEAPICIKDEGPTAGGFPGSPYYTQVDSGKCSYTENTSTTTDTPLQSLPGAVSVPVGGLSAQEQAALKTGEVAITAYRYSQAGESMADGKYTQVGGVSFNLSGDVITKTDSGAQMPASTSTEKVFNNGFACSAWQKAKASLPSGIRSALFKNIASFKITTPDNGDGNSATQLLKLPVGVYSISGGNKTGLRLKDSFCFSVTEGQTKDLKVLLVASSGAEPPSIGSDKISYEKTTNGVNRYFANGYMYIPEYPYYGWQKIDQNASNNGYNTNQPPGLNSQGGIVPGINPGLGIPGGSMADLMRICQSANIQLGGSLDTDNLWQLGAGIGFLTGEGDIGDRLGSGFAGGAIGWLAGKLFGGKNLDFSINVNTISQQCQQLNQVSIPFDCTGCYSGGYCPPGCTAGNPGIQGLNLLSMLFGNNR